MIWLYLTIHCIILGFFGRYVALQKNRSASEGFLFGFFLSLIGILVVAMMPTNEKEKPIKKKSSTSKSSNYESQAAREARWKKQAEERKQTEEKNNA